MRQEEERLLADRDKHEAWLSQQHGVTGIGIGIGRGGHPCLKVYTNRMSEETKRRIHSVLAGICYEFEETGEFRAL